MPRPQTHPEFAELTVGGDVLFFDRARFNHGQVAKLCYDYGQRLDRRFSYRTVADGYEVELVDTTATSGGTMRSRTPSTSSGKKAAYNRANELLKANRRERPDDFLDGNASGWVDMTAEEARALAEAEFGV